MGGVSGAEVALAWVEAAPSFSWLSDRGRIQPFGSNSHQLSLPQTNQQNSGRNIHELKEWNREV